MRPWRRGSSAPTPTADQFAQRLRRRCHLPVTYDGSFDLAEEVRAIFTPLAERVAALPNPAAATELVLDAGDAVHELAKVVDRMLAERDARRRTAHLNINERGSAIRQLLELSDRPEPPEVTAADVADGSWPMILVSAVQRYAAPLAEYLAASPAALTGNPSVAERLEGGLRFMDRSAAALERKLDMAETSAPPAPAADPKAQLRANLAALGIEV